MTTAEMTGRELFEQRTAETLRRIQESGELKKLQMIEAVRELRDRFLDEVNSGRLLPGAECQGKYDVSRPRLLDPRMAEGTTEVTEKIRLLDAA